MQVLRDDIPIVYHTVNRGAVVTQEEASLDNTLRTMRVLLMVVTCLLVHNLVGQRLHVVPDISSPLWKVIQLALITMLSLR